jgi:hypothetical protein
MRNVTRHPIVEMSHCARARAVQRPGSRRPPARASSLGCGNHGARVAAVVNRRNTVLPDSGHHAIEEQQEPQVGHAATGTPAQPNEQSAHWEGYRGPQRSAVKQRCSRAPSPAREDAGGSPRSTESLRNAAQHGTVLAEPPSGGEIKEAQPENDPAIMQALAACALTAPSFHRRQSCSLAAMHPRRSPCTLPYGFC